MRTFAHATLAFALALAIAPPMLHAQPALTTTTPVVPMQLHPHSSAPITLHTTGDAKAIYSAVGKAAGIKVLFDPDFVSKQMDIELDSTSLNESLQILEQLTGTFYRIMTPDTIYVTPNTHAKHNDLDELETQTFYLKNAAQLQDANEDVQALRNILPPEAKVILIPSDNAIVMHTTPENLVLAQKLLNDLDLPQKTYRVTYTVTEVDGTKPVGIQHFSEFLAAGQNGKLKQGTKIPIATGSYNPVATTGDHPVGAGVQTQFTYLDIGMNFDSTVGNTGSANVLKYSIEQSSVAPEKSVIAGVEEPIIRQSYLAGVSVLTLGTPTLLGSIDISGSTRRLDIEVLVEQLH